MWNIADSKALQGHDINESVLKWNAELQKAMFHLGIHMCCLCCWESLVG